ncbi:MAG: HAMP domain-containing histidine kinase [Methylococcaceae bacterium]|nr:HAMP domain-containing histidine kinase [Methylococcaceae bacterium]
MPINARLPFVRRRLFRLRNILLIVTLMVLALPLASLYFFRIYENELVQQTERELISQAAALSAGFRLLIRNQTTKNSDFGRYLANLPMPVSVYQPIIPTLNLINPIKPRRPEAIAANTSVDPIAQQIGIQFTPVMQDTLHVTLSGIRLLDINGTVIAGREEVGLSLAHIPEVKNALKGYYASVIRQRLSDQPPPPLYSISRGTLIRVFIAFPIIENQHLQGVLYLSRTPENIIKHLYAVKEKVFLVSFVILALVALLVAFVSSSISRPIRELISQTHRIRQGKQKEIEPLKFPVTNEIARLSESFVNLSQELNERTDYLRRFAAHMSHEFKTPLTAMQGALELLHDHLDTMDKDRQKRFIDNLLADTLRLRQLVNRLLELARADALETTEKTCRLKTVLDDLQNRFSARGLSLNLLHLPDVELAIAPEVLSMAFHNLFENSLQHQSNRVDICSSLIHSDRIKLQLQDNGNGISRANRDKIFTPFFTTRRSAGGTGLGLAITLSLLKAYQGGIEILPSEQGALFSISLRLANTSES